MIKENLLFLSIEDKPKTKDMKKSLITFCALLIFASTISAQSVSDISKAKEWTWFGIDYTSCYFLSPMDFPSVSDLRSKIGAWNDLVLLERAKFIEKPFGGKDFVYYVDMIKDRNEEIDVKGHISEDGFKTTHLEPNMIQEMINSYFIDDELTGIGLVLIAESYSKPNVKGSYYVTFFDIESRKVISTERMLGKPKGFGLRNYWANSFYIVLKSTGKKY